MEVKSNKQLYSIDLIVTTVCLLDKFMKLCTIDEFLFILLNIDLSGHIDNCGLRINFLVYASKIKQATIQYRSV